VSPGTEIQLEAGPPPKFDPSNSVMNWAITSTTPGGIDYPNYQVGTVSPRY
jgi:hypothetical protein